MAIAVPAAVRLNAIALIILLSLSACLGTPPAPNLPLAPKGVVPVLPIAPTLAPYRLQVGDVLDIKLMLNPELNDQVTIPPDGIISTTVAQEVPAYGRTTAELRKLLEEQYGRELQNPHISIMVRSFAPNRVYVTGEVVAPGEFITIGPNLSLLQAIARAGGVKNSADTDHIVIVRVGEGMKQQAYAANYTAAASGADAASDVHLAPYDVVYVPRSGVGDVYLHYQQYLQEFLPASFGVNYELNNNAVIR